MTKINHEKFGMLLAQNTRIALKEVNANFADSMATIAKNCGVDVNATSMAHPNNLAQAIGHKRTLEQMGLA